MTYREFIEGIREIADHLETSAKESQLVNLDDEFESDDTFLFYFEDSVSELMDNATGIHGHSVNISREQ